LSNLIEKIDNDFRKVELNYYNIMDKLDLVKNNGMNNESKINELNEKVEMLLELENGKKEMMENMANVIIKENKIEQSMSGDN
jgi:hypothetical protein